MDDFFFFVSFSRFFPCMILPALLLSQHPCLFWGPYCVGNPVVAFLPDVAFVPGVVCVPAVAGTRAKAVMLIVACCWHHCCCLRHCCCCHSCCCWRPSLLMHILTADGLPAIGGGSCCCLCPCCGWHSCFAGVLGVACILVVASVPAGPGILILAGIFTYCPVQ